MRQGFFNDYFMPKSKSLQFSTRAKKAACDKIASRYVSTRKPELASDDFFRVRTKRQRLFLLTVLEQLELQLEFQLRVELLEQRQLATLLKALLEQPALEPSESVPFALVQLSMLNILSHNHRSHSQMEQHS